MKAGDIEINLRFCKGCKRCYDICPMDIYEWDKAESLPVIAYPDECWHCGICERECPEVAIDIKTPFHQRFFWGIHPKVEDKSRNSRAKVSNLKI